MTELKWIGLVIVSEDSPEIISSPYKLSFFHFGANFSLRITLKKMLCQLLFDILNAEDDCIDTPTFIKKVKLAKNVEKQILAN